MLDEEVERLNKPVVYITRKIDETLLKDYKESFEIKMWESEEEAVPRDELLKQVENADGLLCMISDQIDEEVFQAGKQLKVVANMGVGYNNIDLEAAKKRDIVVTNTPDVLTETTADLGFALMMATARRVVEANQFIAADKWQEWGPFLMAGEDIHHKTLGIVGMGRIGEEVAKRAKGFDMKVLYHNRSRKPKAEETLNVEYAAFKHLLEQSDYVMAVVPLTDETEKMFDQKAFETMKSTAIFLNISRGQVVDDAALQNALKNKEIKAAGLDVFTEEPIGSNHPYMQMDNVVCLPHIGSATMETRGTMIQLCLDNISGVMDGSGAKTAVTD